VIQSLHQKDTYTVVTGSYSYSMLRFLCSTTSFDYIQTKDMTADFS